MMRVLDEELARGIAAIEGADSVEELEAAQTSVLGRKAKFSDVQRSLGGMEPDDRKLVGTRVNQVR